MKCGRVDVHREGLSESWQHKLSTLECRGCAINVHGSKTSRPSVARLGVTCVVAWTFTR